MESRSIGNARASAESARIGDAVEREQEVRFVEPIEDFVDLCHLTSDVDTGHHARRAPGTNPSSCLPSQATMRTHRWDRVTTTV